VVILAATVVTVVVTTVAVAHGVPTLVTALLAGALALVMVQILARGMTSPLRAMATAAQLMASGDYSRRVNATSGDEVGELGRAFNVMVEELAETDRIRRDLVANVSHELRTPISGLQAALENLVDGVAQPDNEMLRIMLTQTERLGRLVSQLLDLSRLESGTVPLNRSSVRLDSLVDACVAEIGLARPDHAVLVDIDPVELAVDADAERLHQVVTNLVGNALSVTPQGESVTVTARRNRNDVVIEVSDRGPGIAPEHAARVFERFYRADTARASGDAGAGLGLAIVKWIVDLHGGTVAPEPNEPKGCRMVVTLPVVASGGGRP